MKRCLAIAAILLATGAAIPAIAADRAPPLGTVGGIARPGDPNYRPGASVRPDRTFAPNRVGGVARPGDLGVDAPAAPDRPPAVAPDRGRASRMLTPRNADPAARGRANGLGIDDPFAGAGGGPGGPVPAHTNGR
jgi:hypothetical protein